MIPINVQKGVWFQHFLIITLDFRQDVFDFSAHLADLLLAVFHRLGISGGTQVDIGVRFQRRLHGRHPRALS